MNPTDKQLYKTLTYLAKRKRKLLTRKKFEALFPEGMQKTLTLQRYWGDTGESIILTQKGLEELRRLEGLHRTEWKEFRGKIILVITFATLIVTAISLLI